MLGIKNTKSLSNLQNSKKATTITEIQQDYHQLFNNTNHQSSENHKTIIEGKCDIENSSHQTERSQIFQQIDNVLLNNKNLSRQQIMLRVKVQELQKFCDNLSQDNHKLTQKIQLLFLEKPIKGDQHVFVDQLSEMNMDFGQVEILLKEYRQSLRQYQNKIKQSIKIKDEKLQQLTTILNQMSQQHSQLTDRLLLAQNRNQQYQYRIDALQKQIKPAQGRVFNSQRVYSQKYTHKYRSSTPQNIKQTYNYHSNVNQELEIIIEKLMDQLEFERANRKKMAEQINKSSEQITKLQKQILNKNSQIYSLEIQLQKYQINTYSVRKLNQDFIRKNTHQFLESKQNSQSNLKRLSRNNSNKPLKNFTLEQLITNKVSITDKEKLILIKKIINYYQSKIEKKNYRQINPQNLLIFNYNSQHLNMLSLRETNSNKRSQNEHISKLYWNMAYNVVSLINEVNQNNFKTKSYQNVTNNLLDILEQIVKSPQQVFQRNNSYFDQLNHFLNQYFENSSNGYFNQNIRFS